jgi:hypothetical protein
MTFIVFSGNYTKGKKKPSHFLCKVSPNKPKYRNFDTVFYKFLTDEYQVLSKFLKIHYSYNDVTFPLNKAIKKKIRPQTPK